MQYKNLQLSSLALDLSLKLLWGGGGFKQILDIPSNSASLDFLQLIFYSYHSILSHDKNKIK